MTVLTLRKLASKSRGPTAEDTIVLDLRGEYDEVKDLLEELNEKYENIDFSVLDEVVTAYENLGALKVVAEEHVTEARAALTDLEHHLGYIDPEASLTFVEAYEAIESEWDSYVNLKEEDRYDGKADDVQSAWQEVSAALDSFADAVEALGLE